MLTIEARTIQILDEMVKAKIAVASERLGDGNREVITDYAEYRFYVGGIQALKGVGELIAEARKQAETEAGG
jgi:hypothetical protein